MKKQIETKAPQVGRPLTCTHKIVDAICYRLAHGESLVAICGDKDMPDYSTVRRWAEPGTLFNERYARAREDQAERYAEQIVSIGEEMNHPGVTIEEIQVARLRIDARKWIASKLLPKKYGDKPADISVSTTINQIPLSEARRQELIERRVACLRGQASCAHRKPSGHSL